MNIPDYVSPIVAYRAWQWDASGLSSLGSDRWPAGQPLRALCRMSNRGVSQSHDIPEMQCSCGIYAVKDLKQLRSIGYGYTGAHGEVYLWGKIVEHHLGWRAQFAYPKSIVLPVEMIPAGVQEAESSLEALVAYGVDIFLEDGNGNTSLWARETGYDLTALSRFMQKAATTRGPIVPIAVLKEDPKRHILLQNGVEVKHASKVVFEDVRFGPGGVGYHIFESAAPRNKVVVIDLTRENTRLVTEAINTIRGAQTVLVLANRSDDIGIFVRFDRRDSQILKSNMRVDAYLYRDGENDVQRAYDGFRKARSRKARHPGGSNPPGGVAPPNLPPPPPVPVHSSWDISRIIQCTHYQWPTQWSLATTA